MSMRSTPWRAAATIAGAAITSTLLAHGAAAVPPRDEQSTACGPERPAGPTDDHLEAGR
jgi:hypothetical protein